jgi:hypothetical protein
MRAMLTMVLAVVAGPALAAEPPPVGPKMSVARSDRELVVKSGQKEVFRYQLQRPPDVALPVDSGAYFHPVMTPGGVVVTDVAPADHKHHRGIFLAWVEMHGKKDADFWGWGEHAPIKGRRIVNRGVFDGPPNQELVASFTVQNAWMADDARLAGEITEVVAYPMPSAKANVIDVMYQIQPDADLTLSRWAFSGFCVRTRGDGKVTAYSPAGEVKLPNPSHLKPESDWPDAPWYAYVLRFDDGKVAGVAVINHPDNPPTLWHNHRDIRMLNPCIVAPAEVKLKAGNSLRLRYRVVAFDEEMPTEALNRLAEWKNKTVIR